jgi:hypothetical protein
LLLTPGFYIVFFLKERAITGEVAQKLITGVFWVTCLIGGFIIVSILADLYSWLDYRKEEAALLKVASFEYREPPRLRNMWRWHETYAIIFIVVFLAACWWVISAYVLPALGP